MSTYTSGRIPRVDDIVLVPLTHPNGVYLRNKDGTKIPVIAKIRSIFVDTANVINYFGYIYNVPLKHIEFVDYGLDTKIYSDIVQDASVVMASRGYNIRDNSEFFKTHTFTVDDAFIKRLADITSQIPVSMFDHSNVITFLPPLLRDTVNITSKEQYVDKMNTLGTIHVVNVGDHGVLHYIKRTENPVYFSETTRELIIVGYCTFTVDSSYTYEDSNTQYTLYKSQNSYIHVRKDKVSYMKITYDTKISSTYHVKLVKLKEKREHDVYRSIIRYSKKM